MNNAVLLKISYNIDQLTADHIYFIISKDMPLLEKHIFFVVHSFISNTKPYKPSSFMTPNNSGMALWVSLDKITAS